MGASPQIADWNEDGKQDLLVGDTDGKITLFTNTGTNSNPVLTKSGYLKAGGSDLDVGARAAPVVVDWNNDGKKDLVVGNDDGNILLYLNTGTNSSPTFSSYTKIRAGSTNITHYRSTPEVWDLDGDNKKDLLVGDWYGYIYFYSNSGTDANPAFTSGEKLKANGSSLWVNQSARFDLADWDEDGDKDLIVGDWDAYVNIFLNKSATLTVTAPNGGESWAIGTTQLITWSTTGTISNVKIELSRNGGSTWEPLFSSTPNDFSQSWPVTGPASTNCKIKISDIDGSPSDLSDNVFTITSGPAWKVPINITDGSITLIRSFGGDAIATDGFDSGFDVPVAPPGMTYYAYFDLNQFPNYLDTDIRAWLSPYETALDWTLKIVNATGKTSTLSWDATKLPSQGTFTLESTNISVNMRSQRSVSCDGDRVLTIKYRSVPPAGWSVPLSINGNGVSLVCIFGGNPNATDGYDAGMDVPAAPPGMTYYAYFETAQFPNYLSTDMRAWVAPYNTNIDWTLKVVNATGKTTTISWDPVKLPSDGTFTLEGMTSSVNMRTQNSVTFSGDKTLIIKYRAVVIKVIAPNGGENWPINVPQTITWSSTNVSGNVKIEISTNNGSSWSDITPIASNTGNYSWTPMATYVSTNCLIKISSVANPSVSDQSDAVFTISGKVVELRIDTNLTGPKGGTITVPIHCSDVTNLEVYGVGITITYNTSVLEATNTDISGTLLAIVGWSAPTLNITSGQIKMAMAGSTPLSGSGVLVKIVFNIPGNVGTTSSLHFATATLNDGVPAARTTDGLFKVVANYFDIKGRLGYYYNSTIAVKDALLQLTGAATKSDTSVANGSYEFLDLISGNYTVTPQKSNDTKNAITAFDASLILRYSVGATTLTPYQKIAGEVSGNGEVSAYDASLILRYYVGLITRFPVAADWTFVPHDFVIDQTNWSKSPRQRSYIPLNADQENQDFVGILYGDVSGNWPGVVVAESGGIVGLGICDIHRTSNGKWLIPIEIKFIDAAYSGSFRLLCNNPDLKFTSSSLVNSSAPVLLEVINLTGEAYFAFASAAPLTNQGMKINLLCEEIKSVTPDASNFEFTDVIVDDKLAMITSVQNKAANQLPDDWQLCQNHPNPFNAETSISYQLPRSAYVKIEIFNPLGQHLRTLVDEEKSSGTYQISWNGKDDLGRIVGSGIYIYRMKAGDFSAIKKMLLIQ